MTIFDQGALKQPSELVLVVDEEHASRLRRRLVGYFAFGYIPEC